MKLKIFFVALAILGCMSIDSHAQLTTGEPSSKVIRTGNRPEKGDFGLFFGVNFITGEEYRQFTPALNLKYFATDRIEARVGLEILSDFNRFKGQKESVSPEKMKFGGCDGRYFVYPGVAYHFSPKNVIDVYAGAEVPIGGYSISNDDVNTETSPVVRYQTRQNVFGMGITGFVGLQAFIADLPLAISLEYGFGGFFKMNTQVKSIVTEEGGDPVISYGDPEGDLPPLGFDHLSGNAGSVNHHVRLSLSYYFK